MNAKYARKESGAKKRLQILRTQQGQENRNSNIINSDDSEVDMQAEKIVRMQEEEDTGQEYHVQDASTRKQESVPLAESSVNLCRGSRL